MISKLGFECDCFPEALPMLDRYNARNLSLRNRVYARLADLYFNIYKLQRYDIIIVSAVAAEPQNLAFLKTLSRPLLHYEVIDIQGSKYWYEKNRDWISNSFNGFLTVSGIHENPPLREIPSYVIGMDIRAMQNFSPDDLLPPYWTSPARATKPSAECRKKCLRRSRYRR